MLKVMLLKLIKAMHVVLGAVVFVDMTAMKGLMGKLLMIGYALNVDPGKNC